MTDITGPGAIQSMWIVPAGTSYRNAIFRIYWDDQKQPSVEVPIGDFFASAFTGCASIMPHDNTYAPINSEAVAVNPGSALNCFWPMPFQKHCRITMEIRDPEPDPVRFEKNLAITIQALSWRSRWRFLPLQNDIASTAFWYQTLSTAPFPVLGSANDLEII